MAQGCGQGMNMGSEQVSSYGARSYSASKMVAGRSSLTKPIERKGWRSTSASWIVRPRTGSAIRYVLYQNTPPVAISPAIAMTREPEFVTTPEMAILFPPYSAGFRFAFTSARKHFLS